MKYFASPFFLSIGLISNVFSQDFGNLDSKSPAIWSAPKSLQFDFKPLYNFSLDTILMDSAWVFRPEDVFGGNRLQPIQIPMESYKPGVYELPDPQSRIPIFLFDKSKNYTILRKEY